MFVSLRGLVRVCALLMNFGSHVGLYYDESNDKDTPYHWAQGPGFWDVGELWRGKWDHVP